MALREQIGTRDRRQPRHRQGDRRGVRRRRRQGRDHLPQRGAARGRARRAGATSPTPSRWRPRSPRSRPRTARSRCWSPTPASPRTPGAADERGGLVLGHRHQPDRLVPGRQAGRQGHAAAAPRPDRVHLLGRRPARLGRPGQLRRQQGRPRRHGPLPGARARQPLDHRQRGGARLRRDRDDRRAAGGEEGGVQARRSRSAATPPPRRSPRVVHWLASDGAAYVTGAVIPVDGGLGMGH